MKFRISFFVLLVLGSCKQSSKINADSSDVSRWKTQASYITIYRDDFGVPHIYGKTDADAVFGMLYAQCEDDFNRVEMNYLRAIGRLAEVEGEKELYSDLRANLFMTQAEAMEYYDSAPAWLKKLCIAFADGVNYYLYTHPEVKPKLLTHFEPWYPMYFFEGSIGADIEDVSTEGIEEFYNFLQSKKSTGSISKAAADLADAHLINRDDEPRGSNGFALSGSMTKSGNAMLLINPHTSFYFRPEIHVVSEEGLNVYGAVTWGQFFVYQGFNEKAGWMHTSSYLDVKDEFIELVSENKGNYSYKFGTESRPITTKSVTLKCKDGQSIKELSFPIYRTHRGPITHLIDNKWVSTAMMWQPVKALTQSYVRTKVNNHAELRRVMEMRTNSSNNTVFADAEGNIAYYHGNFAPRRDTIYDYALPVDGSNPATDWRGLHSVDECIVVVNPKNGWIQNCNSTPFTCAGVNSPKAYDFPRYMRLPKENFRGVHAIRLLEENKDFDLDKLIRTAYDPKLPAFEKLIPGLIKAYDESTGHQNSNEMKVAIETLRKWDFAVSKESEAMSLAHYYGLACVKDSKVKSDVNFEYLGDMATLEYYGTTISATRRLKIFEQSLNQLKKDFRRCNVAWGEINRFQRLTGDINQPFDDTKPSLPCGLASGKWGALASYGAQTYNNSKRIYGTSGNSFVAVVEFGKKVKAKSLLAGGQSGHPDSPHFYDQAQSYVDCQFKDVAFYREDVELRSKRKYKPGEKK